MGNLLARRVDFVSQLPSELVAVVLTYLTFTDVLSCLLVCRRWRDTILHLGPFWTNLVQGLGVSQRTASRELHSFSSHKDLYLAVKRHLEEAESLDLVCCVPVCCPDYLGEQQCLQFVSKRCVVVRRELGCLAVEEIVGGGQVVYAKRLGSVTLEDGLPVKWAHYSSNGCVYWTDSSGLFKGYNVENDSKLPALKMLWRTPMLHETVAAELTHQLYEEERVTLQQPVGATAELCEGELLRGEHGGKQDEKKTVQQSGEGMSLTAQLNERELTRPLEVTVQHVSEGEKTSQLNEEELLPKEEGVIDEGELSWPWQVCEDEKGKPTSQLNAKEEGVIAQLYEGEPQEVPVQQVCEGEQGRGASQLREEEMASSGEQAMLAGCEECSVVVCCKLESGHRAGLSDIRLCIARLDATPVAIATVRVTHRHTSACQAANAMRDCIGQRVVSVHGSGECSVKMHKGVCKQHHVLFQDICSANTIIVAVKLAGGGRDMRASVPWHVSLVKTWHECFTCSHEVPVGLSELKPSVYGGLQLGHLHDKVLRVWEASNRLQLVSKAEIAMHKLQDDHKLVLVALGKHLSIVQRQLQSDNEIYIVQTESGRVLNRIVSAILPPVSSPCWHLLSRESQRWLSDFAVPCPPPLLLIIMYSTDTSGRLAFVLVRHAQEEQRHHWVQAVNHNFQKNINM